MSPLTRKNLAECKTTALYRAWTGQLFIRDQRVCDLALRSPFSGTIPAQLPAKLEARYVVAVSDLRKKLPAVAFGKNNYANDKVHSQGILFSLYDVETDQNEPKANQLIENLKEKDLALVRYLNERGLFILLASSVLAKEKDSVPEERPRLQALFVISSPRPTRLAAKDLRCDRGADERSSRVTSLLPALRYALAEAAKDREKRVPPGVLVQRYVQEVATLDKNLLPSFTHSEKLSLSFDEFLKKSDLEAVSEKCSPNSFSRLQRYLSNPQNYTLEMSAAARCSTDSRPPAGNRACESGGSLGSNSSPLPRERSVQLVKTTRSGLSELTALGVEGAGKAIRVSERNLQRCKRKSSRLLGMSTRKKWAPLKVLCIMENSKKQKKSKKKKQLDLSSASSKMQRSSTDSGEPTLKLKNLQYPLKRKRGAEVLSAEFVQRTRHEPVTRATSSSEAPDAEQKRPKLLISHKSMEVKKAGKINKSLTVKEKCIHRDTDMAESEIHGDENAPSGERSASRDASPPLRRDECDSHALNMLADLALSSCDSPLLADAGRSGASRSPSRERRQPQREKLSQKASDHEYHRINVKLKGTSLPGRSPQRSCAVPVQPNRSMDSPSGPQERGCVGSGKRKSVRPHPALRTETRTFLNLSVPSLISTEHSYASPISSEPSRKQLPWRGTPSPPSSKNGVKSSKSGPLVGKVLPFRHQQNICHPHNQFRTFLPFSRSAIMTARPKEDFGKSRRVTFCDKLVRVTCQWEAEYLFNVDSKYTNNSLEKTIVRAVHGPWDLNVSDDMEDMKLILHMWVALFYSKPFRSPTARKVVEHSNPAKYVSLNSVVDPLELIDDDDDSEGFCDAGKRSANPEAYQAPENVDRRANSAVEKPLSCNELSSTNCVENESPLVDLAEASDLPLNDGPVGSLAGDLAGVPQAFDKMPKKKAEEEIFLEPVISLRSLSDGSSNEQGGGFLSPGAEADAKAVDSAEVSQSTSASTLPEPPETTKDTQRVTSTGSAISTEKLEVNSASSSSEKEDSCQISSIESPHTSGATWIETNAENGKDKHLCKGEDVQVFPAEDEEDIDGENVELEYITLALSDSNDADAEPRDVDSDQDNTELAHETCVAEETYLCDASSSDDSSTTLVASPTANFAQQSTPKIITESPGAQQDPASVASKAAFLTQMDSVEGFCVSEDNRRDDPADLCPPQTVPFHPVTVDGVTESAMIEGAVESPKLPISPNQTDPVEHSGIAQEDKETCLADSLSLQAAELNQIKNDLLIQGDSVGSQDSLALGKSQTFSNPFDLDGVSEGGRETSQANSALQETNLVHQLRPGEISELLGNQEDSAMSTKCPVSPNQMNLIEAESQEEVSPAELACDLHEVQNSKPTEEESVRNQSDSLASAKNLPSSELLGLTGNSCVPREEKGILNSLGSAPSQNHSANQSSPDEAATLADNREDTAASAPSPVFPEPISSDEGSCTDREEEDVNVSDTDMLEASHQVVQGEQKTGQMSELLNDAVEDEKIQHMGLDGTEFGDNWKGTEPNDENRNNGNASAVEEKACDDKLNQPAAAVPEEIKSFLYELIDTVSNLKAEREGACSNEDSGSNWIGSMALEYVTPPESDNESSTADHLTTCDPELVVDELLEKQNIFVNQEAESQDLSSHEAAGAEREPSEENEAALIATDVLISCTNGTKLGTPRLDGKFQSAETAVSSKNSDPATPMLYGQVGLGPASHEASILAWEGGLLSEGNVENLVRVPEECLVEYPPEESDSPLLRGTSEGQKRGDPKDAMDIQLANERAELPTRVLGPNTNRKVESLSADDDQDRRNLSVSTCFTRSADSRGATHVCDLSPEEEVSTSGNWVYFGKTTRIWEVETEAECFDWPSTSRRDDRPTLPTFKPGGEQGPLKDYINFSITKRHKDKTRTFHSSKRGDSFVEESGLINSLSRTWRVLDDPIQSILDMECLRFHYKLKHILKKKQPQLSTSSNLFAKEFATQVIAKTLPESPVLNLPPWNRSPLLITVLNSSARRSSERWYPRTSMPDDSVDPPPPPRDSFSKAASFRSKGQERLAPFHLNKLTYNNKLKDRQGDISVIMDEFAELSRVMTLDDKRTSKKGQDPKTTSEDVPDKIGQSLPGRVTSYEYLFDDLCNSLHFRLKNVAKEACKKPYSFYLVETDNDPFFGRIKTLLKKGGHTEADPQVFCTDSHPETDRLVVIIRNEDIFLHIHKVPSLLRLKHFHNVTFAGVDSPEDILDHTYQELFHSGGFVVSDDQVLESMTTGELKDVVKSLELLNSHRKWRWLLHHKETKKLRDSARADPAARSKDSILRSCQGANFAEFLHYHRCDSRSVPRSEYLNCLLNLQVQHISARLAVFLTENPSASREAFESKGILVLDVKTFITMAQDSATPCRSNYW
ncbi:protein TASOR 2 [Heteronotia binoei]|uniref:protein TASOR 2 n=1 Tax=Heteronotia binoei TaxID=13085 RepID=UPI00292FD26E|nr:protein TASOR 2 [Heteronotia binoei]